MRRADRVFEARMRGTRIDQARAAELLDAAQPLELRGVDEPQFVAREFDVAVDRIAQDAHEAATVPTGRPDALAGPAP